MRKFINKAAEKLRPIAIRDLMKYLVISMGAVFVLDFVFAGQVSRFLAFNKVALFSGQIWRIISFIFLPVNSSMLFIFFSLYFYWLIGQALENEWGTARFNLFYLVGIIGTIIAGLITGYATNHYLNMSLFLAFAILFPNLELRLFFVLPVKVKWLAWLDLAYLAWQLLIISWPARIALVVSLVNIVLFFGQDFTDMLHNAKRRREWRKHFR